MGVPKTLWPRLLPHLKNAQNGHAHSFKQFLNFFSFYFPISLDIPKREDIVDVWV